MRRFFIAVALLLLALPVSAQVIIDEEITLTAFISNALNVQGVRPESWQAQQNAEGVYLRASDPLDTTAIIMQSRAISPEAFLMDIQTSFLLEDTPEVSDTLTTDYLAWDLYQFERVQGTQTLVVDMAIAEDEETERLYYILLQTNEAFYDDLHDSVFIPAVTWLSPLQFYTDADEQFIVPVPPQWETRENEDGDYVQLNNIDQSIGIFITTSTDEDVIRASEDFLEAINPDFENDFDEEEQTLTVLDDSEQLGGLDAVYLIDWLDPQEGFVLQTVARVYDGTIYLTVIAGELQVIGESQEEIGYIDSGFIIIPLLNDAEATPEVES
ncbi:MAG: hypothetical protein ACFE0Q_18270 [Anaerolineae bacterium]